MQSKGRLAGWFPLICVATALVAGCSSSAKPASSTPPTHPTAIVAAPNSSGGEKPSPNAPDACALFDSALAEGIADAPVSRIGGDPLYAGPNVVCQYAARETSGAIVDMSLVATFLQVDGRPYSSAEWNNLIRTWNRFNQPSSSIAGLDSPGYAAWSFGPGPVTGRSDYIGHCGFAKNGYGFNLGATWSVGPATIASTTLTRDCQEIASRA
jgi:hypothetical protein